MYIFTPESAKELIEKYLSLQWCRDNLTIPFSTESSPSSSNDIFWIAIANYSYLATIASPIKERIKQNIPNIEIISTFPLFKFIIRSQYCKFCVL